MTTNVAKARRVRQLCQCNANAIQPALVPYTQLCTVNKCANDTMTQCRNSDVVEDLQCNDDFDQLPTSIDLTTDICNSLTGSEVSLTSAAVKCSSSSNNSNHEISPASTSVPVTSLCDVSHTSNSSSSRADKCKPTTDYSDNEASSSDGGAVTISGHTQPITSCQLVGDSHIVTSSLDNTVKLWTRTGSQLTSLECSSPVYKAVCIPDGCEDANRFLILAGTESGHLDVWRITSSGDVRDSVNIKRLSMHVPNPVTAVAVSTDGCYLATGSCYTAFGFTATDSTSRNSASSCRLDRWTRGSVKTWSMTSLRAVESDIELSLTCSRTAHHILTSSMTSDRAGGCGMTCLALSEDSSLLVVGLSCIPPGGTSSSSSSAAAAVAVVVCSREKLETLWIADDLTFTSIHDAVFRCQDMMWSLFIATGKTVEMLQITEKTSLQTTGRTLCIRFCF